MMRQIWKMHICETASVNHVIPYFKENINEKTVEHMNRSMDQLREIWDYMERQTESAYQICTAQKWRKDLHPCRGISPTGTADPENDSPESIGIGGRT